MFVIALNNLKCPEWVTIRVPTIGEIIELPAEGNFLNTQMRTQSESRRVAGDRATSVGASAPRQPWTGDGLLRQVVYQGLRDDRRRAANQIE